MKKYIAILLCFSLCLCAVGCKKAQKNNEEAKAKLLKVLNQEESFTFKSLINDSTSQENLKKFSFNTVYSAANTFAPSHYVFVDFDSDGVEELLIADGDLLFCLLLRFDDGTVYGNILDHISHKNIGTDGSFLIGSFDQQKRQICKVTFDGSTCQLKTLAYINESKDEYQLDYQDAPQKDVETYFSEWDKNTEKVTWEKIEQ